jgi:two-component system sensor histidine kinase VicK
MVSIKFKLVFLYITMVFLVMATCGSIIIVTIRQKKIDEWEIKLKSAANYVQGQIQNETPENYTDFLQEAISDMKDMTSSRYLEAIRDIQIFITSGMGNVKAASTLDNTKVSNSKTIINAILSNTDVFSYGENTKTTEADGSIKTWIDYAKVIKDENGDIENIIYTRALYQTVNADLQIIVDTILLASFLAFVLSAILGLLFASTLTSPIQRLTKKSKELAEGDSYQEIPVSSKDEIGQLTSSFNYMAQQLKITISNIESEKSKLEFLLHNMTDGVLAIDIDGKIIHANSLSQEFLGVKDIKASSLTDIATILGLNIADINEINNVSEFSDHTVRVGDKYINAIISTYMNDQNQVNGIIIVLRDFTKHQKLDNMRKEFVANVSHEMRTPLTTIKGYTETLLDGALDDKEVSVNFLNVIDSEADRMTFLVQDLLELSRFDNQQLKIELSTVNLISVIKETIIQNKLSAEKKRQAIIFNSALDEIYIEADRGRAIQVLANVVSNAIKYSPENSTVEISISELEGQYRVDVKDNGMGIPPEDLNRIFERFYRVDKARSRAMGGTGLGLAIAKEIMDSHNGKIFAESQPGVGTTISLIFNKPPCPANLN